MILNHNQLLDVQVKLQKINWNSKSGPRVYKEHSNKIHEHGPQTAKGSSVFLLVLVTGLRTLRQKSGWHQREEKMRHKTRSRRDFEPKCCWAYAANQVKQLGEKLVKTSETISEPHPLQSLNHLAEWPLLDLSMYWYYKSVLISMAHVTCSYVHDWRWPCRTLFSEHVGYVGCERTICSRCWNSVRFFVVGPGCGLIFGKGNAWRRWCLAIQLFLFFCTFRVLCNR